MEVSARVRSLVTNRMTKTPFRCFELLDVIQRISPLMKNPAEALPQDPRHGEHDKQVRCISEPWMTIMNAMGPCGANVRLGTHERSR